MCAGKFHASASVGKTLASQDATATICDDKAATAYDSFPSSGLEKRAFANSRVRVRLDNPASKSIRWTSINRTTTVGKSATSADHWLRKRNLFNPLLGSQAPQRRTLLKLSLLDLVRASRRGRSRNRCCAEEQSFYVILTHSL